MRMNQCAGLASGPASRPSSMWIEMSQYIPNTAVMSAPPWIASGNAAQPGRPTSRPTRSASRPRPGSLSAR
jgi:hypothetical protein